MFESDFEPVPLSPELIGPVPRALPPGQHPRGLALVLTFVLIVPIAVGGAAVVAALERGQVGEGPGAPAVLRDLRIERVTGRHAAPEQWRASLVYTDAGGQPQSVTVDLPADVARTLPAEQPTVYWTYRDLLHQEDVRVPREGLAAAKEVAAHKLRSALIFAGAFVLVAVVMFLAVVRKLWRRGWLLRNGEIVAARVVSAQWRVRPRVGRFFQVRYQADLPGGSISGAAEVTGRQRKRLGRAPQANDTAFVVYDPLDPRRCALWGVARRGDGSGSA